MHIPIWTTCAWAYDCFLYVIVLQFPFIGSKKHKHASFQAFQHDSDAVNKARFVKTWFTKVGVTELDQPEQNPELNSAIQCQAQSSREGMHGCHAHSVHKLLASQY